MMHASILGKGEGYTHTYRQTDSGLRHEHGVKYTCVCVCVFVGTHRGGRCDAINKSLARTPVAYSDSASAKHTAQLRKKNLVSRYHSTPARALSARSVCSDLDGRWLEPPSVEHGKPRACDRQPLDDC